MIIPGFAYIIFDYSFIDKGLILGLPKLDEPQANDSRGTEGLFAIYCMFKVLFQLILTGTIISHTT